MEVLVAYAFLINIFSFISMYVDKQKAIKGQWRIAEKNFFIMAIAGGSLGIFLAMRSFRHKTKHVTFKVGIPLIFLIQIVLIGYYL
ncbi:DUF1294 domain-containing protein [Anaerobacillus sp. CMMVII]|nr:DUF1294 domain-containing protein [Anaerobacillus sp. CMMVII]